MVQALAGSHLPLFFVHTSLASRPIHDLGNLVSLYLKYWERKVAQVPPMTVTTHFFQHVSLSRDFMVPTFSSKYASRKLDIPFSFTRSRSTELVVSSSSRSGNTVHLDFFRGARPSKSTAYVQVPWPDRLPLLRQPPFTAPSLSRVALFLARHPKAALNAAKDNVRDTYRVFLPLSRDRCEHVGRRLDIN
jgi:hypothetical protein